ncbi:MAG: hypothetical protein HYY64_15670 [Candidatus Rokubacteria bacterium]|nr:hypothetical protein [Candidatus Rokubacteria bacterium]
MKIRNLTRKSGQAIISAWPPLWVGPYRAGDTFPVGEEGVLRFVKRLGDRLSLTMEHEGRECIGGLEWDQPPTLEAVERVLRAHVGQPIKVIGDLDV